MGNPTCNLMLSFDMGKGIPEQKLYEITTHLLDSIAKTGVDSVKRAEGKAVKNTKGFPVDINTLIINLTSVGALTAIIQLVRDWAMRTEGRRVKMKVQIGNKVLEFEYNPTMISEKELLNFVKKLAGILEASKR